MKFYPGMATALSFSGGLGSSGVLQLIIDGVIPRPQNFIVCNADPGGESSETYKTLARYKAVCASLGIPFLEAKRNLFKGLLGLKASSATRFDLPPFWTKNRTTGKKGRLLQRCTKEFKIAPMDRLIRDWLEQNLGIPRYSKRIGTGTLHKLIGFSSDEWHRIKEAKQHYVEFRYPLIDLKMTKADLKLYFIKRGLPVPARSVCQFCYANDVDYFKEMHADRPDNWAEAVAVDEAIRDLRQVGVEDECFVSSTLIPLRVMAEMNFENLTDQEMVACHSGHCFV